MVCLRYFVSSEIKLIFFQNPWQIRLMYYISVNGMLLSVETDAKPQAGHQNEGRITGYEIPFILLNDKGTGGLLQDIHSYLIL